MKIHKQEVTFQPITIVLESQEEVDTLIVALNIGCGDYFEEGFCEAVPESRILELVRKKTHEQLWENIEDKLC